MDGSNLFFCTPTNFRQSSKQSLNTQTSHPRGLAAKEKKKLNKWSVFQKSGFQQKLPSAFQSIKYICFLKLVITADCHH